MESQFPSNAHMNVNNPLNPKSPPLAPAPAKDLPEKNVEAVVTTEVTVRKRRWYQRAANSVFKTDMKTISENVLGGIIAPAIKNTVVEAIQTTVEKAILGEVRSNRNIGFRGSMLNHVNYAAASMQKPPGSTVQGTVVPNVRPHNDFSDYLIGSRMQAEQVVLELDKLIGIYGLATKSDLKGLLGISSEYTDNKWGWYSMAGADVRGNAARGYTLELPDPQPIN